jgi:hypothetical protein
MLMRTLIAITTVLSIAAAGCAELFAQRGGAEEAASADEAASAAVRPANDGWDSRCSRFERLAVRAEQSCRRMLRHAESRRVDPTVDLYELKATVLAWRDARLVCGEIEMWTAADQRRMEDVRVAVMELFARRARVECVASMRDVYDAVERGDLPWAELALAEARTRCSTTIDNRERIIAAEKMLTQFRRSLQ